MTQRSDDERAELRVRRLRGDTPPARLAALDRILRRAEGALVSRGEHLASAMERALDAEGDRDRLVLYATRDGRTLGIIDASIHAPAPGELTIAQLAVRADARRQGLGRRLVAEVLRRARVRLGPDVPIEVHAAVRPGHGAARAFWEQLGLEPGERGPTLLLSAALGQLTWLAAELDTVQAARGPRPTDRA